MTKQDIFREVAYHMLNQGRKALNGPGGTCVYRAPNGDKCAAGCLIPDELYDDRIEGNGAFPIAPRYPKALEVWDAVAKAKGIDEEGKGLIRGLQRLHDRMDPSQWRVALEGFANAHDLGAYTLQNWDLLHGCPKGPR